MQSQFLEHCSSGLEVGVEVVADSVSNGPELKGIFCCQGKTQGNLQSFDTRYYDVQAVDKPHEEKLEETREEMPLSGRLGTVDFAEENLLYLLRCYGIVGQCAQMECYRPIQW